MPHPHLTRDEAISIHALREEGDTARPALRSCAKNFYPRPPRGGRQDGRILRVDASVFLSTPSARRATIEVKVGTKVIEFLSTPSARRATIFIK